MQHALSDVVSPVNDGFDHHIRIHTKELPHKKIHTNEKPQNFPVRGRKFLRVLKAWKIVCCVGMDIVIVLKGSSDAHFPQVDMIL